MNFDFLVAAGQALQQRAENAEKSGNAPLAAQNYKLAADNYRQAAACGGDNAAIWLQAAKDCESKAMANKDKTAQKVAAQSKEEPVKEKKTDSEKAKMFEGYDLEVVMPKNKVSFDDIIGLDDAKRAIKSMLINPLAHPEEYKKYGLEAGGFILLYGPAGTGKTTFAKAAASQLDFPFISKNCNTFINKYIGETGKNISNFFSEVRRFVKEQNTPVILYLDEIDEIAKASGEADKVADEAVPALKTQLDGFDTDNENIFMIAATNLVERLDSAIKDRFSKRIYIPLPDEASRGKIFRVKLQNTGISQIDLHSIDFDRLAKQSQGMSGRQIDHIAKEFLRLLADRDAGELKLDKPLTEVLLDLIHSS